jgi:hypothetical protein
MIASRRINLVIDSALLVSFVAVMMSGLFISKTVLGVFGLHAQAAPVWRLLHSISAQATVWLLAAHVGMHARWIAETTKRLFAAPGKPASRSAMPAPDSI